MTLGLVRDTMNRAARNMTVQANKHRCAVNISVASKAWLSTEHLKLAPGLTCKLAAKWAGLFPVVEEIGAVAFRLQLSEPWRVHNVFHASHLKPAVGATAL